MRVSCPSCGRAIPGADFDVGKGIAVCRPCGEVVALPRGEMVVASEAKIYKPENVRLAERVDGDAYVATIPPNRLAAVPAIFFCVLWDGFMAFWYAMALTRGAWLMAVFGLGHLGVGVYLTHQMLVGLFNVRTFRIDGGRVTFRSAPIPFAGTLDVGVDEIDAFAVVEHSSRGSVTHRVVANLKNGTSRKLDVVTSEQDGTRYIAQSFNDALRRARATASTQNLPPYRG